MKTPHIFLLITITLSLFQMASPPVSGMEDRGNDLQSTPSGSPAAFSSNAKGRMPAAVVDDWFSAVRKNIQAEEYDVTYRDHSYLPGMNGAFQAPNRAHNLRTYFTPRGVAVIPRTASRPEWVWRVNLKGYGYSGDLEPVGPAEMAAYENRMEYRRGDLVEWYVNSPEGLEQGFTLNAPPLSRPEAGGLLVLEMEVEGNLEGGLDRERNLVDFTTPGGVLVIRYGKLQVRDDTGRNLTARIDFQERKLRLLVDDTWAVYPLVIDPLAESPDWSAESNRTYSSFGYFVGTAGDVNGDGYEDVIIGAEGWDGGQDNEGRAYVYLGSADGLASSPDWTREVNQYNARFGCSVGTAGDVNGDGYADVIVGAKFYTDDEENEGGAWVFLGSAGGLAGGAAWMVTGDQEYSHFGHAVGTAGDVNADGYSDIIVGAPYYDNGQDSEGAAYVYHGSASGPSTSPDCTIEVDRADAKLGSSVAFAGDVNGDGYADVIIGAPDYSNGQNEEGRVFLYYGSSAGVDTGTVWKAESNQAGSDFGGSVATAGDVNGDGYSDVIVGAKRYSNGEPDEGRAYVYLGASGGLSTSAAWVMEIDKHDSYFGGSVATAGDVNGDGFADVIVGIPYYSNGQTSEGGAFVYLGSHRGLAGTPAWTMESGQGGAWLGHCVGTAGDVNGDGFSDIIIGVPCYQNGQVNEGRAYVLYGSAWGLFLDEEIRLAGDQNSARYGWSIGAAGDINGDGYGDVIIGAPYYDNGQTNEGRAYVYLGKEEGLDNSPFWRQESNQEGARFGYSVGAAGDVNGDGYDDIIVGAPYFNHGQTNEGRAYVYHGSGSRIDGPIWTGESDLANTNFGISVGAAGDVNGDGYADVVVGAPNYDTDLTAAGKVFAYYGSSAGLAGSPAWTAEGETDYASLGNLVGTAGDVNGDGYSDIIVSSPLYYEGNYVTRGRVYVYHGSTSGLAADPGWTATGSQTNARFGTAIGAAGDVNGDGFSDIIVGAHQYANGQAWEGRAFVYHGSNDGLSASADWTGENNIPESCLGFSVAGAGDVNGDGYADVIIGAPSSDWYDTEPGLAYVYHGSAAGLSADPDETIEGDQADSQFGYSVTSAGDLNGDGYADVVIGAPYYDDGQMDEGKIFLYFGNHGVGVPLIPQQRKSDDSGPVCNLGMADRYEKFRLALNARTPFGRSRVKLEWEVKPLGELLDGTGTGLSSTWTDTKNGKIVLNELIENLVENTAYHWRVRLLYDSVTTPLAGRSRWLTMPRNGWQETDLRTAVKPKLSVNNVSVAEDDSGTASLVFTISLSPVSTETVTVNYATADHTATVADGDYAPQSGSLTFSPGEAGRTVTVTVNGDTVDEDNETFYLNLSNAVNADIDDNRGVGTIVDDDEAALSISNITVAEPDSGTVNAVYKVGLSNVSTKTVTVDYATADGTAIAGQDYTGRTGTLSFSPGVTSKNITVSVNGDVIDEDDELFFLNLSGAQNASISDRQGWAKITDNDTAAIYITDVGVTEGDSGTVSAIFSIRLTTPSSKVVKVYYETIDHTATLADGDYVSVSGSRSFAAGVTGKNVAVAVNGDQVHENNETFYLYLYNATNADISDNQGLGTITDDDTTGFKVGAISGHTGEDESQAAFTVKLTSQPNGKVVLNTVSSDTTEGRPLPSSLTFTTSNWNANQTVTVTGVDDQAADGNQDYTIRLTVNSSDTDDTTGYKSLDPDDVVVTNVDNDTAGFTVSPISGQTREDGTSAIFTVKLNSSPNGNVVVKAVGSDTTEGSLNPSRLGFTTSNWSAPQTVTVTGLDDQIADGNQDFTITLTIDTSGTTDTTGYASLDPPDVMVTNLDDESAGFIVGAVSRNTQENGQSGVFTVSLTTEPDGQVVINVASSDETEGKVIPSSLTFTPANWNAGQTVTVTGQDDDVADGNQDYAIRLAMDSSATTDTTGYGLLDPPDVSVTNLDDETAGFMVGEISNHTGEDGESGYLSVRLTTEPDGDVVLEVTSSDETEGIAQPSSLTFTPATWNIHQTVTVTGRDDDVADGNQDYTVRLTVDASSTTDTTGYADLDPPDVAVINLDDETPGFIVSEISGDTDESQGQASFTVVLATEPNGSVVLDVASSDVTEGEVSQTSLTFGPENWHLKQEIVVTGVDDDIHDGNQPFTVRIEVDAALTTDTTGYASLNPYNLSLSNIDNDHSYTVTALRTGTGSGTIITVPSVINCGVTCSATVAGATPLTFIALATEGSIFDGWSVQGCSGTGSCILTVDGDTSVTASFSAYANQNADLAIAKTSDTYQPEVGDRVTFTLTLTNHGPDQAVGIEVTDILPEGLAYISDDSDGNYDASSGLWTVDSLDAVASTRLNITVLVESGNVITNTVEITGTGVDDPNSDNDSAGATLNGTDDRADLAVSLACGQAPLVVGDEVVYTINVSNAGPDTAEDAWLTDYLPSEISNPEYFTDGLNVFTAWPDSWQLSLGNIEAKSDLTVWIKGALTSRPANDSLTNTVSVVTGITDPSPGNNLATDETMVLASVSWADLSIVKTSDLLEPLVGEDVVFTLTAANPGPDDAYDMEVEDLLPDGLIYVSDDGAGAYDPLSGLWKMGNLAAGTEQSLQITVQAAQTGALANTARITSSSVWDDNDANNSSTRVIGVETEYIDLALSTALQSIDGADPDQVLDNDRFNFRVNLAYNSTAGATGVTIQTRLPDGVGIAGVDPSPGCYDQSAGVWYLDNDQVCEGLGQSVNHDNELNPVLDLEVKVLDASLISQAPVMAAVLTADQPDPDTANNTSCQILNRNDAFVVDLAVQVEAARSKVGINEEAVFTITVRNTGPDTASGIRVLAVFPEELGYTGSLPSRGAYDRESGQWFIGVLKKNESAEILVKAAPMVDSGLVVFQAVLSAVAEGEMNLANNTDSAGITIVGSSGGSAGSGGCYLSTLLD